MKINLSILLILLLLNTQCGMPTSDSTTEQTATEQELIVTQQEEMNGIPKYYTFDFGKETKEITLPLSETIKEYFEAAPKTFKYQGSEPPKNWEKQYYDMFLENSKDEFTFKRIIRQLEKLDGDIVELAIAFVQGGLPYDWDSYYSINSNLKYPYETLFLGKGVCSDKTLVLGKLLSTLGYDICFFAFPKANHIALGLKVPAEYGSFGTSYAFVETTNYKRIGIVPATYESGVTLEKDPTIIYPSSKGSKTYMAIKSYKAKEQTMLNKYGENYWAASAEQKQILEDLYTLKKAQKSKRKDLDQAGCEGVVPYEKAEKCQKLTDEFNEIVLKYNKAVEAYNRLNQKES